jgi:hypothetical protein
MTLNEGIVSLEKIPACLLRDFPEAYFQLWSAQERGRKEEEITNENVTFELLQTRWQAFDSSMRSRRALIETERELESLWSHPKLFLQDYERALLLVRARRDRFQREAQFDPLVAKASQEYRNAIDYTDALLTKASQGKFQPLLEEYMRLKRVGYTQLPGLSEKDGKFVLSSAIATDKAITQIRKLAREYASRQAEAWLAQAKGQPIEVRRGM